MDLTAAFRRFVPNDDQVTSALVMSDTGHVRLWSLLCARKTPSLDGPQPRKAQQVLPDCSSTIRMRASSALMPPCVPHSPASAPASASASGPAAASIDATTLPFATSACTKPTPQTVSLPLQQTVRAVVDPPQLLTAEELARLWCEEVLVEGLAREEATILLKAGAGLTPEQIEVALSSDCGSGGKCGGGGGDGCGDGSGDGDGGGGDGGHECGVAAEPFNRSLNHLDNSAAANERPLQILVHLLWWLQRCPLWGDELQALGQGLAAAIRSAAWSKFPGGYPPLHRGPHACFGRPSRPERMPNRGCAGLLVPA